MRPQALDLSVRRLEIPVPIQIKRSNEAPLICLNGGHDRRVREYSRSSSPARWARSRPHLDRVRHAQALRHLIRVFNIVLVAVRLRYAEHGHGRRDEQPRACVAHVSVSVRDLAPVAAGARAARVLRVETENVDATQLLES